MNEMDIITRCEAQERISRIKPEMLRIVREKVKCRHIHGEYMEAVMDGKTRRLLHYASKKEKAPVYFDIHGGGMAWGMIEEGDLICHRINEQLGYECYALDYPLQPEHPYPEGLYWLYDTIRYMQEHADRFHIDKKRMVIGGRSAGGCLTAALCILAERKREFQFACQVTDHMCLDLTGMVLSEEERYNGEGSLSSELRYLLGYSYAAEEDQKDSLCNPILASEEELRGMPPAVIQTCELDSLRKDGDTYAKLLIDAGIPVVHRCAKGALHGFTEAEGPLQEDGIQFLVRGIRFFDNI